MLLEVKHFFDASHQLPDSTSLVTKACSRMHGHTYKVIVQIEGSNNKSGMVIDFKAIKNVIDVLDHQHINSIFDQRGYDIEATAENIAKFLFREIKKLDLNVISVAVCEGYKGEDRASYVTYYGPEVEEEV